MENNEISKQIQENNRACFENPFVYGLIHTPVNRSEFQFPHCDTYADLEDNDYEYFMSEAEAFSFVYGVLGKETEYECNHPFAIVPVRTFDLPDRNDFRMNNRSRLEIDFSYPANTLADLFEYSEGEQFYHSPTV